MSKELIKKLKALEKIAPQKNWQENRRAFILSKIDNTNLTDAKENLGRWGSFYASRFAFWTVRPVAVSAMILIVAMSGGIATVGASRGSLPGDTLYSVKLASEQVKLALTTGEVGKAKVQLSMAENRVQEIKELVKQNDSGKNAVIKNTVKNLKVSVTAIQDHIAKAQEKEVTNELIALAEEVNTKTKEYANTLKESNTELHNNEVSAEKSEEKVEAKKAVDEAVEVAQFTSTDALRVLIYQEKTEKIKINQEEVLKRLNNEIEDYKTSVTKLWEKETATQNLYNSARDLAGVLEGHKEAVKMESVEYRALSEEELTQLKEAKDSLANISVDLSELINQIKDAGVPVEQRLKWLKDRSRFDKLIDDLILSKASVNNLEKYVGKTNESVTALTEKLSKIETDIIVAKEEPKTEITTEENKQTEEAVE
ncbi:MAG: hypothetical protein PHD51_00055 [Patescibacteria group bacterium]|nr:hypothetical protein [Patescibacteria group bacterium]MDD5490739.1 hypothetical protein [Patescibacteria group bacterium]